MNPFHPPSVTAQHGEQQLPALIRQRINETGWLPNSEVFGALLKSAFTADGDR